VATLVANDVVPHISFGESVSISGDAIAVGGETPRDPETNVRKSAIHLFEPDNAGAWQSVFSFGAEAPSDERGGNVAISGGLAVLGVPRDDLGGEHRFGLLDYGSAYIFARQASSWNQIAHVQPDQLLREQYRGRSVAVDDSTVLIGAYGDAGLVPGAGAAYVFQVIPEPSYAVLSILGAAGACFWRPSRRRCTKKFL
jgi:hypothetical protein